MTLKEVARELGRNDRTILRWIQGRHIEANKITLPNSIRMIWDIPETEVERIKKRG